MQGIDGSQDEHGYRTNRRAATTDSEGMTDKHSDVADPIPLYLVPQVVGANIRRFGRQIEEIHVRQAAGNHYAVTVVTREEAV
ncbi:MAG: hypothetical protein PWP08_1111 [Methanofollis sp.]|nr:hypothetical protein [Methanofollis sp.]